MLCGATRFENCGRDFAKRKQSDAEMREILRMVIIDTVINTLLGGLTLDPAGMHCPARDDAFWARRLSVERNSYGNVAGWVAGWQSVTAGIVSKRLNVSENFFDHLIAPS